MINTLILFSINDFIKQYLLYILIGIAFLIIVCPIIFKGKSPLLKLLVIYEDCEDIIKIILSSKRKDNIKKVRKLLKKLTSKLKRMYNYSEFICDTGIDELYNINPRILKCINIFIATIKTPKKKLTIDTLKLIVRNTNDRDLLIIQKDIKNIYKAREKYNEKYNDVMQQRIIKQKIKKHKQLKGPKMSVKEYKKHLLSQKYLNEDGGNGAIEEG